MIRTLILTSLLFATACRINHLGADHGVASRAAWAAQRESDPERAPKFGADDAKASVAVRRSDKGKAGGSTAPAPGSILMPSPAASSGSTGGSSAGAWQGAKGGMSLEAK
jgi:hypothetical protein